MSRQSGQRQVKKSYIVLGDGQTEYYYLRHLKKIKAYKYIIRPSLFDSITIETVEGLIDEYLSGDCDQVIYFTDYDTIVNQNKLADFQRLKKKYANVKEVLICETMPSIEFWFLLHFIKTTREFKNSDEVIELLVKYIDCYSKGETFLNNIKWVETLCSNGKLLTAIKHSSEILLEKAKGDKGSHFSFSNANVAFEWFDRQK